MEQAPRVRSASMMFNSSLLSLAEGMSSSLRPVSLDRKRLRSIYYRCHSNYDSCGHKLLVEAAMAEPLIADSAATGPTGVLKLIEQADGLSIAVLIVLSVMSLASWFV